MAMVGCNSKVESGFATSEDTKEKVLIAPEPLKLLAIGVAGFDDEISRQWSAQRDGDLKITHLSLDEFASTEEFKEDFDLVVHPSSISVDLISSELIRVFPRDGLVDPKMNQSAFMRHFRKSLVRHNDKTWSVSLGGNQLRLFYRKDILDAGGIEVPETWEELNRAIEKLEGVQEASGMKAIVVPTASGIASQIFMAQAASRVRDQGKLTSFFDRKTMKPTVDSPPFEKALGELKVFAKLSGGTYSVAETFAKFAAGEAVFAIAWPCDAEALEAESLESDSANWGVVRLPGTQKFYDLKESIWMTRDKDDESQVDLLGVDATNISISSGTSNAKDATEFVIWLTDKRNSQKLLQGIAAPFRATHLARVGQWYGIDQADREFLDAFADSIEETHKARIFLMFPQLPGKQRYLKTLDDAIAEFLAGQGGEAKDTLQRVEKEWEALTESLDRSRQVNELRRGNGI